MKNYKIINDCDIVFQDYNLRELAVIKKNGRKSLGNKISVQSVMRSLLKDYGVFVSGGTWLKDLNGDEFSDGDQLIYASINKEFPIGNEEILRQMYGYTNATINIGLYLGTGEDCAYSFQYNLVDFSCVFLRHYWGSNTEIEKFDTLKELLEYLQTYKIEEK